MLKIISATSFIIILAVILYLTAPLIQDSVASSSNPAPQTQPMVKAEDIGQIRPKSITTTRISEDTWNLKVDLKGTKAGQYRVRGWVKNAGTDKQPQPAKDEFYSQIIAINNADQIINLTITEMALRAADQATHHSDHNNIFEVMIDLTDVSDANVQSPVYGGHAYILTDDKRLGIERIMSDF